MTDVLELPNPATLNGEQLRQIVNDALDAIVVMDDKGLLVGWNSQAEFVFGWSGQEVIGQPMSDVIIPPQHRAAHRQGLEHYLKTGEGPVLRRRIEVTALRKNGDEFPVELSISPVHFEDGVIFSAFVRDISAYEHKGSEADLAKRAAALEVVAQVAAATSTILETDKLLQGVVDLTKERFGLYHAHIYLLDRTGDMLGLTAGAGETGRKMVDQGWRIPFAREQSLVAQAARRKKGTIVNDVQADPNFLPNPLLPNTRSEMAVPMMAGDRLLGVLDVQADTVGRFTDEELAGSGLATSTAFTSSPPSFRGRMCVVWCLWLVRRQWSFRPFGDWEKQSVAPAANACFMKWALLCVNRWMWKIFSKQAYKPLAESWIEAVLLFI
ncbi:MAG: hypothetical protein B6243_11830 [Anaerolineaceae bacterium 4572_5.2]|nr:MAG: hypothetical protein B6243_11830 [Anaerolineaceae bacterium 4572_5.2]